VPFVKVLATKRFASVSHSLRREIIVNNENIHIKYRELFGKNPQVNHSISSRFLDNIASGNFEKFGYCIFYSKKMFRKTLNQLIGYLCGRELTFYFFQDKSRDFAFLIQYG